MTRAARSKTAKAGEEGGGIRLLKKYPNRRLYDTRTSSYITLTEVKAMVLGSETFEVRDAKTGDDLTRSILLQIILEEETGGVPMFSAQALAQIIRLYGHGMQGVMGDYLERNMQAFTDMQGRFTEQSKGVPFSPELWSQFLAGTPMKGVMETYAEQSKSFFEQWQEQMKNAGALFPGVPGFPPKK